MSCGQTFSKQNGGFVPFPLERFTNYWWELLGVKNNRLKEHVSPWHRHKSPTDPHHANFFLFMLQRDPLIIITWAHLLINTRSSSFHHHRPASLLLFFNSVSPWIVFLICCKLVEYSGKIYKIVWYSVLWNCFCWFGVGIMVIILVRFPVNPEPIPEITEH